MTNQNVQVNGAAEKESSAHIKLNPPCGTGEFEEFEMEGLEGGERRLQEKLQREVADAALRLDKAAELRKEKDIVKRAAALSSAGFVQYPEIKHVQSIAQVINSDRNRLCFLDAMFDDEHDKPHMDLYRGRIVDHEGVLIDQKYPVQPWLEAFALGGLKGLSIKATREILVEFALKTRRNDLSESVARRIPEWDEKQRMDSKLITLFQLRDEPLPRTVGKYFWLSLYNRIMTPGALAPVSIALIGAQGCGKSLFAKKLCQVITGDKGADSVQLNLGGNFNNFLRAITGQSIVANVGEMAGFTRSDINEIKDITTRTSDKMDFKYEGTINQQRQWIIILDGNKYELQRDETGNRRFMPLFCAQVDDVGGKLRWRDDFQAVFDDVERGINFEEDVWQIMAECAAWMNENGMDKYEKFTSEVVSLVKDFSAREMKAERGTLVDNVMSTYLDKALSMADVEVLRKRDGSGDTCVRIDKIKLLNDINSLSNGKEKVHPNGLKKAMEARGAEEVKPNGIIKYRFDKIKDVEQFRQLIAARYESDDDEESVKVVEVSHADKNGF